MICSTEIENQTFNFCISYDEINKLKYLLNIIDFEQNTKLFFMNLVKFKEGGYIRAISSSNFVMLDINIPMKKDSNKLCNFWCNYEKSIRYKNLKSIKNICGPWKNVKDGDREIQTAFDLKDDSVVDYHFVFDIISKILCQNFAIINTGWTINDFEMQECKYFCNLMTNLENHIHNNVKNVINDVIIEYKFKKLIRLNIKKYYWKKWLEHWYDPENKNGFIKRFIDIDNQNGSISNKKIKRKLDIF